MGLIRGLLLVYEDGLEHLIFKCPHCKQNHGCFVDPNRYYHNGFTNVWQYQKISDTTLQLHPSFDNSKFCGWHGPYEWQVEIMVVGPGEIRNESTEAFLNTE